VGDQGALQTYFDLLRWGDKGWSDELIFGTLLTLQISFCGYIIGLCFGLLGAWGKLSGNKTTFWIAEGYTTLIRAVPELLLILLLYYVGTDLIHRLFEIIGMGEEVQVNGFAAAVVVLGFVQGAYSTEVLRGAILSVPKGQIEAAKAYGMPPVLRFRRILFPLMIRYALPGLNNLWVNILKDSSLISVVGLSELVFQSKTAASGTKHYFFFYSAAGVIFLVMTYLSNTGIGFLERRVNRGVRRA
jgi:polar amino acid transport system permease protein